MRPTWDSDTVGRGEDKSLQSIRLATLHNNNWSLVVQVFSITRLIAQAEEVKLFTGSKMLSNQSVLSILRSLPRLLQYGALAVLSITLGEDYTS